MSWTDDRVDTLKKLWNDGESASAIARTLGEVTPQRRHRQGAPARACRPREPIAQTQRLATGRLSFRPARLPTKPVCRPARASTGTPRASASHESGLRSCPNSAPPPDPPVTVQTLTERTCRWPEGDPKRDGFHFCGRAKAGTPGPYCDHHAAIAFR